MSFRPVFHPVTRLVFTAGLLVALACAPAIRIHASTTTLTPATPSSAVPPAAPAISAVVSFGDSLSDYGNNGIATTSPTSKPPSRITGTWVKQLATLLDLPMERSRSGGTNYARGGAVSSGMMGQVNAYLAAHPVVDPDALHTFFGGGNDIMYRFTANPLDRAAPVASAARAVANIQSQITKIAEAGGRRFLWLNMFPMEHTPLSRRTGLALAVGPAIERFNQDWAAAVADIRARHPDITIHALDFHALCTDVFTHPEKHGLKNVTQPAQGKDVDPDTYAFADELHPTSRIHQIIALAALDLLGAPRPADLATAVATSPSSAAASAR